MKLGKLKEDLDRLTKGKSIANQLEIEDYDVVYDGSVGGHGRVREVDIDHHEKKVFLL